MNTGYDPAKLIFVKGKVEETLPESAPEKIALVRLNTDWYESKRHELVQLYPRVSAGGVLIIDDYGHWLGSQKATDEYFMKDQTPVFLNRIDYAERFIISPDVELIKSGSGIQSRFTYRIL